VSAPVLVNSGGSGAQATSTVLSVTGAAGDLVVIAAICSSVNSIVTGIVATGGGQTWTVLNNQSTNSSLTEGYFTLFYTILTAGLSAASITVSTAGGSGNSYPTMAAAYVGFRGASGISLDINSSLPAGSSFASTAGSNTLSNVCSTSEQPDFFLSFFGRISPNYITALTSLLPSGSSDIFEYTIPSAITGINIIDFIESPSYSSPQSGITVGATDPDLGTRGGALITIAIVGAGPPPIYPESVLPQINLLRAQTVDEDIIAGIRPLALRNRTIPLIGPSVLVLADRVMETTNTTGTGTVICTGPVAQYQPFTAIGANNTTWYAIISGDGVNWETGIGTITQLNPSGLARTTVLSSSNGGALISLAGVSQVWCDVPAAKVQTTIPTPTPPPFSQIVPIVISSTPVSITLGGAAANWYPSVGTFTFTASQLTAFVGRLRRSATTVGLSLGLSKNGGSQGYLATSQSDGNLVQYYNVGSGTVLISAGSNSPGYGAQTHFASTSLIRWFISINGVSNNVMWANKDTIVAADTSNTNFDLTSGNWTLYVSANSYSDIQSVVQNIAPEYGS
jgi:hypothetical protein